MKTSSTPEWEGLLTAFVIILTVLFGTAYVIAWNYHVPIPWLLLIALSLLITIVGSRLRRNQRSSK